MAVTLTVTCKITRPGKLITQSPMVADHTEKVAAIDCFALAREPKVNGAANV